MSTSPSLEDMNLDKISKIIKKSLGLDSGLILNPETKLTELGAEDIDVVDIMFGLGVPILKYISDYESRQLKDNHTSDLLRIAYSEAMRGNLSQAEHLGTLAHIENASDFVNQLTVADCYSIGNYVYRETRRAA